MRKSNPNHAFRNPLGIRISVWFIIFGLLLVCVFLINISPPKTPDKVESGTAVGDAAVTDVLHKRSSAQSVDGANFPETVSEPNPVAALSETSAAISNELRTARAQLTELRSNYSDESPSVKEQVRATESLERSALTPGETLELAKGRAELAKLEVKFSPQHPAVQAQRQVVESLEQSARLGESFDLAQAKAQLAKLRVNYGDGHPDVQSQLKRVADLQR